MGEFLGPFLTNVTGWCSHQSKNMVLYFYAHKRSSMSLVQFTYIQTLHEEQKIVTHTLVATESMFVFWSALWNFPKPENSFILCWEKFAFSFHLLYIWIKRFFYVWLKKPRKWRKHWVTMLFTNVFLSCRSIFFLQVIRGAKIQCREESIMRHLPCSPSCPYSAVPAIPF